MKWALFMHMVKVDQGLHAESALLMVLDSWPGEQCNGYAGSQLEGNGYSVKQGSR